jgi:hypothetical protein
MDFAEFHERMAELIFRREEFGLAEAELDQAKMQASEAKDLAATEDVLSWLVTLNLRKQPPDQAKAEFYCVEREQLIGTGYAKLQYAMTLYWSLDDPNRAAMKAREAIKKGRAEGDDKTVYQSLGLLGLALLDLTDRAEAFQVLDEIREMVNARLRIVVGDETLFLERLHAQTREAKIRTTIQEMAKTLSPVCRDPDFTRRLKTLAEE